MKREYKELYQAELSRRVELNSAIERPISLITIYSGVIYFIFSRITQPWSISEFFQICLIVIVLIFIFYAIYQLTHSFMGHTYAFLPTPKELEDYRIELISYYVDSKDMSEKEATTEANTEVFEYIYSSYAGAAHQNAQNNDQRSAYLYNTKKAIVWGFPIVVLVGIVQVTSGIHFDQLKQDICLMFSQ